MYKVGQLTRTRFYSTSHALLLPITEVRFLMYTLSGFYLTLIYPRNIPAIEIISKSLSRCIDQAV